MVEFLRKHWNYLLGALALHVLFVGVFSLTMLNLSRRPPPVQMAIQAVVVDQSVLNRASRQQQRARERERQKIETQQHEQEAEARQREQQETERREAEQRAELERQTEVRQREEAEQQRLQEEQMQRERQEAQRKQEAEAEQKRQAEAERKRVAEIERKQKEAAERRRVAQDAEAQAAREEDLRGQLEEEEGRTRAENSGLLAQYIAMIEQRIVRNWNRPPSARPGLECEVRVAQTPSGTVLSVQLGRCNGDAAVRQSIEAAVMRASPLPPPPDPRLFERNLVLVFKPAD